MSEVEKYPAIDQFFVECGILGYSERPYRPSEWFEERFRSLIAMGPAFFVLGGEAGQKPSVQINEDFFAGVTGGERRLGHRIVYSGQEGVFYFKDPLIDAFRPAPDDRIELLISNYLIRCAAECEDEHVLPHLVTSFRKPAVIKKILLRAKSLLAIDGTFFSGEQGKRRFINGNYVEPTQEPSYGLFVRQVIVANPEGCLTLPDAFHRYFQFCTENQLQPLRRADFRHFVSEVLRDRFNIGFRHDVKDSHSNKQNHGWMGVTLLN